MPEAGALVILPSKKWDDCPGWSIKEIPNNLSGVQGRLLGMWLKDSVGKMPIACQLPKELSVVLTLNKKYWMPGIKAAVVWLWAFLIRYQRYMTWPN